MKKAVFCAVFTLILTLVALTACSPAAQRADHNGKLYYGSLSTEQKALYEVFYDAAEKAEATSDSVPYSYTEDEWRAVLTAVMYDNPKFFGVDMLNVNLMTSNNKCFVEVNYIYPAEYVIPEREKIEASIKQLIDYLTVDTDSHEIFEEEIAIQLHDYVVSNTSNNIPSSVFESNELNLYDKLKGVKANSLSYAVLYKMLCDAAGIECEIVDGNVDGFAHSWNMVRTKERVYYVDTYFDDPDYQFENGETVIFHAYCMLGRNQISKSHIFNESPIFPYDIHRESYYTIRSLYANDENSVNDIVKSCVGLSYLYQKAIFDICADVTYEQLEAALYSAIDSINEMLGEEVLKRQFRIFPQSDIIKAYTILLIYN